MKILWRTLIALFVLVGTWIGVLSARRPWITPAPGVRLEPLRPPVREEDIRPGSAYALLREAVALLPERVPDDVSRALFTVRELPPPGPDLLHTNTTLVLDYCGPALDLLRRAARAPQESVFWIGSYPYSERSIINALAFSANRRMADGDLAGALDDMETGVRLSDIMTRGGGTFAQFVDSYMKFKMCALLVRMAAHTEFPVERMRQLQSALREIEFASEPAAEGARQDWQAYKNLWESAGGSHRRFIENSGMELGGEIRPPPIISHLPAISVLLLNPLHETRANVDAVTARYLMLLEQPYDAAAIRTFESGLLPLSSGSGWRGALALLRDRDPIGRFFIALGLLIPNRNYHTYTPTKLAALRATQAALAVHRFRAAEGRLPNDLAELVPVFIEAVPTDPFDGQPLRYQRASDDTFSIYSVGKDGRDDGGNGREGPYGKPAPDLVF